MVDGPSSIVDGPSSGVLWGAGALALIGAATALALEAARKRKEEEERLRAEMEAHNAALRAKEEAALAAAIAAANAAAAAKAAQQAQAALLAGPHEDEWQEQEIGQRSAGRDQAPERREVVSGPASIRPPAPADRAGNAFGRGIRGRLDVIPAKAGTQGVGGPTAEIAENAESLVRFSRRSPRGTCPGCSCRGTCPGCSCRGLRQKLFGTHRPRASVWNNHLRPASPR